MGMTSMRRFWRQIELSMTTAVVAVLVVAALGLAMGAAGCGTNVPPNLGPQARVAWQGTQVIQTLDMLRDVAIGAQEHGLLAVGTVRRVVEVHRAAIQTVHAAPAGWQATVETSLQGLSDSLSPGERKQLDPYIQLALTVVKEVL